MHSSTQPVWTGVIVIAAGLAVAWGVRSSLESALTPGASPIAKQATEPEPVAGPLVLRVSPPSTKPLDAVPSPVRAELALPADTPRQPRTQLATPDPQPAPPKIDKEYGGLSRQLPPLAWNSSNPLPVADRNLATKANGLAEGKTEITPESPPQGPGTTPPDRTGPVVRPAKALASEPRPPRIHTVRDRDTLASIAERYYGSADFAGRIFAANRHLLADPQILPVGARLVIPDLDMPVGEQPLAPLSQRETRPSNTELVPLHRQVGATENLAAQPANSDHIEPPRRPVTQLTPLESNP
ncbi:MAG: hypothetical protein KatS3mg109_1470 [Pirellulaceae bacterium]|nr:MAG: hypothetical protein KatS3mg109_1470 [Pirellulaceae bacterium]GIW93790.1 MAG: hypothetical protein KatS3mg110_1831 [Pirellulaceae bacterium]